MLSSTPTPHPEGQIPAKFAWLAALLIIAGSLAPEMRAAGINIDEVAVSPDVSIEYFSNLLTDEQASVAGSPALRLDFGLPPGGAEVTGFHIADSKIYFAVDQTVKLGETIVTPQDVVLKSGSDFELVFEGASVDLLPNTKIDAVTFLEDELCVSFDTTTKILGEVSDDEDLVMVSGNGPVIVFDGSASGIPPNLDLDAAHFIDESTLALSLDGAGKVVEIVVADEDVFVFNGSSFEMLYDGSAVSSEWRSADLDGLFIDSTPPAGLIFEDGFESANTSAWSASSP